MIYAFIYATKYGLVASSYNPHWGVSYTFLGYQVFA